jgi:hypothetical protein
VIKYMTWLDEIKKVEVEKETDSSVWAKGKRIAKRARHQSIFDGWEEAKEHLLKEAEASVISARRQLEYANSRYGNIKGMKPPKE